MENHADINDVRLAELFREGDELAFKELFDRFYRPLKFFATRFVKDPATAEDIVVDAMSKLWNLRKNFETVVNIKAFLYITVRNNCLSYIKYLKRTDRVEGELRYLSSSSDEQFALAQIVKDEVFELLRQAIDTLPPQRREILILSFFHNRAPQEIADRMNLSVHTVRNTKSDGIRQLRELLFKNKILVVLFILVITFLTN